MEEVIIQGPVLNPMWEP